MIKNTFRSVATKISILSGSATVFMGAVVIVISWAITGPIFNFSTTWQLFINTFTTITTFLMVFLIQNTQNRDSKAVQLKLDELILATSARDALIDLEEMTDEELAELDREFHEIHEKQATSRTMKKLHANVIAAHEQRQVGSHQSHRLKALQEVYFGHKPSEKP